MLTSFILIGSRAALALLTATISVSPPDNRPQIKHVDQDGLHIFAEVNGIAESQGLIDTDEQN